MAMTSNTDAFYSVLANDPDLGEIVGLYVAEMPDRIALLKAHFASGDRGGLTTLAHQIKGSAGSHGFHQITPYATTLEQLVRGGADGPQLREAVEALVEACGRAQHG